ncbi:MAG: acyl--CoA ligase [Hyphomicrobiaceae bacterium]|nr:acyl--CoA ligase [Hyphomicrobiaceae bacterium]
MPPLRFNMAAYCIGRAAAAFPEKPALVVISDPLQPPAEIWTFAQLEDAVLRVAAALRAEGLEPGARLMIRLENTSTYALLFFGAIAAGCVPLPASSQLTGREAAFLLEDSGAAAVALSDGLAPPGIPAGVRVLESARVRAMTAHPVRTPYAATACGDPAYLIYTSGTTSRPKGVLHAQRAAWGRRPMYRDWYGIGPTDRVLHAGAFNWTYTLGTGLTDPWANAATAVVYTGRKDPAVWPRLITAAEATIFAAVPSLYRQILQYAKVDRAALGRLRHGLIAGETPPPGLFEEWTGRTGLELYEALGMSELSTYVSSSPSVLRKPGAVGKPQAGRSVAILPVESGSEPLPADEEGLLAVHRSDPGLMLGYWQRPAEEAEVMRGDWFIGGDLARIDEDGYVIHCGRADDIMKALGYRVAPQEVEATLAEHPAVAEVACAEVRVRADVSVIGAFIVVKEGAPRDAEAVKRFAAERLAAYKCPREIVFLDALPRTANGKLRRGDLKAWRPA